MPESLPDECGDEQQLTLAHERDRMHPLPEMHESLSRQCTKMLDATPHDASSLTT
jgi:hypothetical protein